MSRSANPALFAKRLKELMRLRGLTQVELARLVGIRRPGTISDWRRGNIPEHKYLRPLARALGVGVSYLLGIQDSPEPPYWPNERESELLRLFNLRSVQGQMALIETLRDYDALHMDDCPTKP